MSFEHRFGVGIGGSHEDPYIPQFCEECPDDEYLHCPKTKEFIETKCPYNRPKKGNPISSDMMQRSNGTET